jgi:hypothetical protein
MKLIPFKRRLRSHAKSTAAKPLIALLTLGLRVRSYPPIHGITIPTMDNEIIRLQNYDPRQWHQSVDADKSRKFFGAKHKIASWSMNSHHNRENSINI